MARQICWVSWVTLGISRLGNAFWELIRLTSICLRPLDENSFKISGTRFAWSIPGGLIKKADKLIAFAGIVKHFNSLLSPDDYASGLWKGDLIPGLLWYAEDMKSRRKAVTGHVIPLGLVSPRMARFLFLQGEKIWLYFSQT